MVFLKGFSLVELFISLALAAIVWVSLLTLLLNHQTAYRYQEAVLWMQENGRMALHFLQQDIRMAGYIGCGRLETDFPLQDDTVAHWNFKNSVRGYHAGSDLQSSELPASIKQHVLPNSDVIVIRRMSSESEEVMQATNSQLLVGGNIRFSKDDIAIISDCFKANVFQVLERFSHSPFQRLVPREPLASTYLPHAMVGRYEAIAFYLANTHRFDSAGNKIIALYKADLTKPRVPREIVEGVEKFEIRYSIRQENNHQLSHDVRAQEVMQWEQVVGLRIALLLNSVEPVLAHSARYTFQHQSYQASDRLLRNEWETYIALRERLP